MRKVYNSKFKKDVMHILPGEFFVSSEYIINTILGSCIAVVLYSEKDKIGGMNHFMLPSASAFPVTQNKEDPGRYGVYAMELLINELMHNGIKKNKLSAKVFGGGRVLHGSPDIGIHVGARNTAFVLDFLKSEKIHVVAKDVGGDYGRKIYFFPWTGKVLLSDIRKSFDIEIKEKTYIDRITHEKKEDRIIFFNDN